MKANSGQFKKGHKTWNKDKKCPHISLAMMGNKIWLGRKHSEESRTKMRIGVAKQIRKTGEQANNWRGGIFKRDGSYVFVNVNGKYQRQHRVIVEKRLDRKLKNGEFVHHINFNKHDNRVENLYLFRNRASHVKYHAFLKRNGLDGTNNQLTSNLFIYV